MSTLRQHLGSFAADRAYLAVMRMGDALREQSEALLAGCRGTLYYDRIKLTFALHELLADFWLSLAEQCQRRPREAQGWTPFSYTDEQAEAMTAEFVAAVGQLEAEPDSPAWTDEVREAAAEVLASHLVEWAAAEARKAMRETTP